MFLIGNDIWETIFIGIYSCAIIEPPPFKSNNPVTSFVKIGNTSMQTRMTPNWQLTDFLVSIFVLILLFWFTYIFLVRVPYAGFYFNPTNGQVVDIYVKPNPIGLLQKGDLISQVGEISWNAYKSNPMQGFFNGIRKDQVVNIAISRNGQLLVASWPF